MDRPKCCRCIAPASVTIKEKHYCGEHGLQQTQVDKRVLEKAA